MASKKALEKAYDGGQAAQAGGFGWEGCPFEPGEESDKWMDGYEAPLAEKWQGAARNIEVTIRENQ